MKTIFKPTFLLCVLGVSPHANAAVYAGNGNSGFGDVFGATGSLTITDDGTDITISLARGTGAFDDTFVLYIDSVTGGFSGTGTFTDTADGSRRGISDSTGEAALQLPFPRVLKPTMPLPPTSTRLILQECMHSIMRRTSLSEQMR